MARGDSGGVTLAGTGLALLYADTLRRVRRDYARRGRLSRPVAAEAYTLYLGHAALTAVAARRGAGPLPLRRRAARLLGGACALAGARLYGMAARELGSFTRTSGLQADTLVTAGIYRRSRNPQNLGWGLLLTGAALAGRSGVALGLAGLYWLGVHGYLVAVEEPYLRRRFGERYRRYLARTPRYLHSL